MRDMRRACSLQQACCRGKLTAFTRWTQSLLSCEFLDLSGFRAARNQVFIDI